MQILAFYGEAPYTACMALLPLAILFLYLALARGKLLYKILAGVFIAATVLANAFGGVVLAAAAAALVASGVSQRSAWRQWLTVVSIAVLAYAWISPALPPSVLAAIRMNSPTSGGDYRFTARSLAGVATLAAGFAVLWFVTWMARPHLRFFLLFAWLMTGIVVLGVVWNIYVVPQPHRYQIAMDMALWLAVTGILDALASPVEQALRRQRRRPRRRAAETLVSAVGGRRARTALAAVLLLALAVQGRHVIRYARGEIRSRTSPKPPPTG